MGSLEQADRFRGVRGEGSQRERRPGVWEVRVPDPDRPGARRSYVVHGTAADARALRARLVTDDRGAPTPSVITVAEVLTKRPWR